MNLLIQYKTTVLPLLIAGVLSCFGLLPKTEAVAPAPDGGYPGGNTAEGQAALLSLTTGGFNTAVGLFSLRSDISGSFNTAIGAGTLLLNTADDNTATGVGALLSNTTGADNTANGFEALLNNTDGSANVAMGASALLNNTAGFQNTAIGLQALANNTTGHQNTAIGLNAGHDVTTANNVICIGDSAFGENVNNSCYIGHIFAQSSPGGIGVFVNTAGKLGTTASSERFKEGIKPMERASEAVFSLKPVTFRYKKEIDPAGTSQFGLVAEEVDKVNPDLVVRDKEGKPYSVRYDQVNAMLLNEFLKEHCKVEELQAGFAEQQKDFKAIVGHQQKQIEALTAGLQKVSAQLELTKTTPQAVATNP
jgi:hypothetical protein